MYISPLRSRMSSTYIDDLSVSQAVLLGLHVNLDCRTSHSGDELLTVKAIPQVKDGKRHMRPRVYLDAFPTLSVNEKAAVWKGKSWIQPGLLHSGERWL